MASGNTLVYDQVQGDGTFTDLVRLIKAFNTSEPYFEQEVEKIVDLDTVAKCFAFTFASGMGDNMYSSANNYLLYYNPHRGMFEVYIMDFEYAWSYDFKVDYLIGNIYDPPILSKPNEWYGTHIYSNSHNCGDFYVQAKAPQVTKFSSKTLLLHSNHS